MLPPSLERRNITVLTPSKYWRVPCALDTEILEPSSFFTLPDTLASQVSPPARGDGIALASYDEVGQTGIFHWVGVIGGGTGKDRSIEWRPCSAQIWVNTGYGRMKWKTGAFGFAAAKILDYGLHELWAENFDHMELRGDNQSVNRTVALSRASRPNGIGLERLTPIEVVGSAVSGSHAGVVYVLKSAYGFKVGRTRNVPARMRAFGVHLPFVYTIPLCVWFEDCHNAERHYHEIFAHKRINGEWFDLDESDIQQIRLRK